MARRPVTVVAHGRVGSAGQGRRPSRSACPEVRPVSLAIRAATVLPLRLVVLTIWAVSRCATPPMMTAFNRVQQGSFPS